MLFIEERLRSRAGFRAQQSPQRHYQVREISLKKSDAKGRLNRAPHIELRESARNRVPTIDTGMRSRNVMEPEFGTMTRVLFGVGLIFFSASLTLLVLTILG